MSANSYLPLHTGFKAILAQGFENQSTTVLKEKYDTSNGSVEDRKNALDQAFREQLFENVIEDTARIERFIAFSIAASRLELANASLPVSLISDIFDAVTLDQCEQIFTYVEDNVAIWREDWIFLTCKNNLLRICNDLLRRLSRTQNTVFCGRILLFLAKFFPFSERSGLNVVSEFNLENLTEYESSEGSDDKVVPMGDGDATVAAAKIDHNLYCQFWALQDFFRNPNQCYNSTAWHKFSKHIESVLSAFTSFKLEEPRGESTKPLGSADEINSMDVEENDIRESQLFFAKFLTNPKLLVLQLSDSNFRRSVLVQCLILFQYLRSSVKFKAETYSLSSNQSEYIKETEVQIYKLLDETPPNGKRFVQTVRHMLQREELWNTWKNDGCKEFSRPNVTEEVAASDAAPIKAPPAKRQKRSLGDSVKESIRQNRFYMGNTELTRLWNICPDNLQACRGEDRNFLPSIETYLENPKDKIDQSFEWRALRLLARQSPHFFSLTQTPNKVSDYLEGVRKKIKECSNRESGANASTPVLVATNGNSGNVRSEAAVELSSLKSEEIIDSVPDDSPDADEHMDRHTHKVAAATTEQMAQLSVIIGQSWKKLGTKLGYSDDLLLFFADSQPTPTEQCQHMLRIWFDEDDDASLDNLAYILEGLDMIAPADAIKRMLEPADKMEDISE